MLDQAVGYATFANGGVPVRAVPGAGGARAATRSLYAPRSKQGPAAFSEDVAADATYAMQQVVRQGTGRGARLAGGRDVAGKTGTSSDNRDAWFVGFTPQLSTAVWLGYADPRTIRVDGVEVTGGGFSSRIFKSFMDPALEGMPEVRSSPSRSYGGKRGRFSAGRRRDDRSRPSPAAAPVAARRDRRAGQTPPASRPEAPPSPRAGRRGGPRAAAEPRARTPSQPPPARPRRTGAAVRAPAGATGAGERAGA